MKKALTACLTLSLVLSLSAPALAAPRSATANPAPYTIEVDGKEISATAHMMVPLRAVGEALGFTVTWRDGAALVDTGTMHTTVTPGRDLYVLATSIDGLDGMSAPFSLGAAPYISGGITYVPLSLLAALLNTEEGTITVSDGTISVQTQAPVQIPNPFVDCKTLEEAQTVAGFSIAVPALAEGYTTRTIRAIKGDMIEVIDRKGDTELRIRKAVGTKDTSGDYTPYPEVRTVTVGALQVELRGTEGSVQVATWTSGGHSFSISASSGITAEAVTRLIQAVQ